MSNLNKINQKTGLIRTIILIVIAIIVISFFGFDLQGIIEAPQTQKNLSYVWGFVVMVWDNYLSVPALYFWHNIFLNIIWDAFTDNLDRIKSGEGSELQTDFPAVPAS